VLDDVLVDRVATHGDGVKVGGIAGREVADLDLVAGLSGGRAKRKTHDRDGK